VKALVAMIVADPDWMFPADAVNVEDAAIVTAPRITTLAVAVNAELAAIVAEPMPIL
tara:strand:+ start:339 stop:509 length:171 start_codon:yes stop_codon:yes gene_type:complete